MYKSVKEIHHKLEGEEPSAEKGSKKGIGFAQAMGQIILIDMIFSFDSIITAGGTAKRIEIMIAAVVIAMIVMFLFSSTISSFIHKHPTLKMLALSFLVMIGFVLLVEGWNPEQAHGMNLKNYVYFSMAFSFSVELLNMRMRKKTKAVELREPVLPKE
jgi:predicted tellurium resistance membrane protein TerC